MHPKQSVILSPRKEQTKGSAAELRDCLNSQQANSACFAALAFFFAHRTCDSLTPLLAARRYGLRQEDIYSSTPGFMKRLSVLYSRLLNFTKDDLQTDGTRT